MVKVLSSEAEHGSNGEDFDRMLLSTISMIYGQLKGLPRPGATLHACITEPHTSAPLSSRPSAPRGTHFVLRPDGKSVILRCIVRCSLHEESGFFRSFRPSFIDYLCKIPPVYSGSCRIRRGRHGDDPCSPW
jgi:hypothetical protein